jgi:hypothetical protein
MLQMGFTYSCLVVLGLSCNCLFNFCFGDNVQ